MKILVTGGAGYIGSHAVLGLLEKDYDVVVFDNLEYGHEQSLNRISETLGKKIDFVNGDLRVFEDVKSLFEKHSDISAVLHFAAFALVGESVEKPYKYFHNNVYGTLNLLRVMQEYNVDKIVFSSTCATYGEPERMPIDETLSQNPINPYGRSKLMVEQMLNDAYTAYGLNSIRFRYFNAAGASTIANIGEDHRPETHLIPLVLNTALGKREKIFIFGDDYETPDGTCIRDYIHVEDLVDAHILALEKLFTGLSICDYFNLGTEKGLSVKEIIDKCKEITEIDFTVEVSERRPGDPPRLIADSTKAKEFFNWQPKHTLDSIISSAWKWHKENEKGYL